MAWDAFAMDNHKSVSFFLYRSQLTCHLLRDKFADQSPNLTCHPKHWDTSPYSISLHLNFHWSCFSFFYLLNMLPVSLSVKGKRHESTFSVASFIAVSLVPEKHSLYVCGINKLMK